MLHFKKAVIIGCLAIIVLFFITCSNNTTNTGADPRGNEYAGAAACASCHKVIEDSYMHTRHFNASAKADYSYVKNLVTAQNNTVNFTNGQKVVLSEQGEAIYQTYYKDKQQGQANKIDVAFGAAVKAQTYAYWKEDQLFQLPLTYLTQEKIWTNSPGFPIDHPYFNRPVVSRCMECHTSFALGAEQRDGNLLRTKQVYNPASIVYGIDCERCHGPGAEHVKFQQDNPTVKQAKFITSFKTLSRQQQMDLCGSCHSGDPVKLKSIFNFKPGDTLSRYYMFFNAATAEPDVHGMQSQLLQLSKCYRQSQLTCTTCHQPHQQQAGLQAYVNQCITCHQQVQHKADVNMAGNNCITCHMPQRPSKSLDFNNGTQGHNIQYMLRTHRIAVYSKAEWQ